MKYYKEKKKHGEMVVQKKKMERKTKIINSKVKGFLIDVFLKSRIKFFFFCFFRAAERKVTQ